MGGFLNPLVHYLLGFLVSILLLEYCTREYPEGHHTIIAIAAVVRDHPCTKLDGPIDRNAGLS